MTVNALSEIKRLVVGPTRTKRIIEVTAYDRNTGIVDYRSSAGTGTFTSQVAYAPGTQLYMESGQIIGPAEPLTRTIWLD